MFTPKINNEYSEEFIDINFPELKELCIKMVEAGENEKGEKLYQVVLDPKTGGSGGVSDYDLLVNRPKINGVTLTGNKTSSDLGLSGGGGGGVSVFNIQTEADLTSLDAKVGDIAVLYSKTVSEQSAWRLMDNITILGGSAVKTSGNIFWNYKREEFFMVVMYTSSADSSTQYAICTSKDGILWTYQRDIGSVNITLKGSVPGFILAKYSSMCYFIDEDTYEVTAKNDADLGSVTGIAARLGTSVGIVKMGDIAIVSYNSDTSYGSQIQVSEDGGSTWRNIKLASQVLGLAYGQDGYIYIKLSSSVLVRSNDLITFETINLTNGTASKYYSNLCYNNGKVYWVASNNYSIVSYDVLDKTEQVYDIPYYGTKTTVPYLLTHDGYVYVFEQKLTSGNNKHPHRVTKTADGINFDLVSEADNSMDSVFNSNYIKGFIKDKSLIVCPFNSGQYKDSGTVAINPNGELHGDTTKRKVFILVNDPNMINDWIMIGGA